nr:MAG TPA: hypothetical protein [Crassvirales sp.]
MPLMRNQSLYLLYIFSIFSNLESPNLVGEILLSN